jgi:hypothetical protein
METTKAKYQEPQLEVIEFNQEDSIATSGVGLNEQVWGA